MRPEETQKERRFYPITHSNVAAPLQAISSYTQKDVGTYGTLEVALRNSLPGSSPLLSGGYVCTATHELGVRGQPKGRPNRGPEINAPKEPACMPWPKSKENKRRNDVERERAAINYGKKGGTLTAGAPLRTTPATSRGSCGSPPRPVYELRGVSFVKMTTSAMRSIKMGTARIRMDGWLPLASAGSLKCERRWCLDTVPLLIDAIRTGTQELHIAHIED
ncbi:hypothetical protein BJV74DRAFT_796726 [Russula compacta]|nr:hypothetical protein BJV74DRAFT_796726 [Russula compacta]